MASSPMTSWQIDGEKVKIVADFLFLGMVTEATQLKGTCSLEEKL